MFIFTSRDARSLAKKLEGALTRKSVAASRGQVLDSLAVVAGFKDWNAWSASLGEDAVDEKLRDFEMSHIEGSVGDEYGLECRMVTHTGFELRYAAYGEFCEYVRVCDPLGREVMYWHYDEWGEDPKLVMGAILGALTRGAALTAPKVRASQMRVKRVERPTPTVCDLDFHAAHAVVLEGQCYNIEWREDKLLALLGTPHSAEFEDLADSTALSLHYEDNGLVHEEGLTLGFLASLTWNQEKKYFTTPKGESVEFFMSYAFGAHPQ